MHDHSYVSLEDTKPSVRLNLFFSILSFQNYIVGAGLLTMPYTFTKAGYISGCLLLLVFGLLCMISCWNIFNASKRTGKKTYSEIAGNLYGKFGKQYTDLMQFVYSVGAMIGYLVLIKEQLYIFCQIVISKFHISHFWVIEIISARWFLVAFMMLVFILPASLLRSLHELRYINTFSIVSIVYIVSIVVSRATWSSPCSLAEDSFYKCSSNQCIISPVAREANYFNLTSCKLGCEQYDFQYGIEDIDTPFMTENPKPFITKVPSVISSITLFSFVYACQVPFTPLLKELANPTKTRVSQLVIISVGVCILVFQLFSMAGYFSFCGQTAPDILDSFKFDDNLVLWGRVALTFTLSTNFPFYSHAIRGILHSHFWADEDEMNHKGTITTLLICGITFTCAVIFSNLDTILGLTGAIAATQLLIIIPFALRWKVERLNRTMTVDTQEIVAENDDEYQQMKQIDVLKTAEIHTHSGFIEAICLVTVISGIILSILSVYSVLNAH